jgi:glycosyltransferase involved in cell wall biosynthesis
MRVCFLSGNIYPLLSGRAWKDLPIVGGAEIQQLLIAQGLARRGIEVTFITEDYGQGSEIEIGGFRVLAYTFGRNKIRQGRTLSRAMGRSGADVFYIRGVPRYMALIAWRARAMRRPLVMGIASDTTVRPRPESGRSFLEDMLYRWSLRRVAAVIAQTTHQREELWRNYGRSDAVVIRNAAAASPVPPEPHAGRSSVAWIATLHPYKGIERLFELALLRPDQIFEVFGGPDRRDEGYYAEMEDRARAIANVRWRGILPNPELNGVLARAIALVHTASFEGFPNVFLEAWRNGTPVLSLTLDPDELICREGLGFHCATVEEMATCVDRLRDATTWNRISASARSYFEREHGIERIADDYVALLERVVAGEKL